MKHSSIQYSQRILMIVVGYLFLYLLLLINIYRIQIVQNHYFSQLGQQQYQTTVTVTPPRAEIVDRNGKPVALNKHTISAFITPSNMKHPDKLLHFLQHNFPSAYQKLHTYTQIDQPKHKKLHFMYIKRRLTSKEELLIKSHNIPDIYLLEEPGRYYPVTGLGSLIGLTNIDNQGISGIELLYDKKLSHPPITEVLQKDAHSGYFYYETNQLTKQLNRSEALTLTIDSVLQYLTYQQLKQTVIDTKAVSAAAIITNPVTGEILALANYPEVDTNATQMITVEQLKNNAISDAYELGSVIKLFLALAALEEQVVTPDEIIDCEQKTRIKMNGSTFSTWKAHGEISFIDIIKYSNNIGAAKVAQRLGPKLYDHYRSLGFGSKLHIFPGEQAGFINPPHLWSNASILSLSFGYEMSATIIQLAQALSVLSNKGSLVSLKLIKDKNTASRHIYSKHTIKQVRTILRRTIEEGTAKSTKIPGYTIMGKTGTARLLTNGTYDPKRCIYTFGGTIEKNNYKRTIVTFVKEAHIPNAYAATIAVPLFKHITKKMLIHENR